MHELAITEGIIEAAIPAAKEAGAKRILEIRLKVGELSGVIPECVYEYFKMLSEGTIAEGARIITEKIPAGIKCDACGYEGGIDRKRRKCPECGSLDFKITSGMEYYVDSLEAE